MMKKLYNPQLFSSSGTYTGNDSANRAIPHGLGRIPALVIIWDNSSNLLFFISKAYPDHVLGADWTAPSWNTEAVTAMTSTNFYVGNAADYPNSANKSPRNYKWTAIP